jgi:hypothetical protein
MVVEQPFLGLKANRRLVKDYEYLTEQVNNDSN